MQPAQRAPSPASHARRLPQPDDCRCLCGSLLARVVDGAVELKCRRCKRTLRVELPRGARPAALAVEVIPVGETG